MTVITDDPEFAKSPLPEGGPPLRTAVLLGLGLFAIFVINGREIGAGDVVPNKLLPIAVLRGDGLTLNRFNHLWGLWSGASDRLPYFVSVDAGRVRSRYPPGAGLLVTPLVAPQVALADYRFGREWERDPATATAVLGAMAKNSAAALAALTGMCLYALLWRVGCGPVAIPATLIAVLGSNLWMTASQSLWQHSGATLALALALLLATGPPTRARLAGAGTSLGVMMCCRPQDVVFTAAIAVGVILWQPRRAMWFLLGPIVLTGAQIAWNVQEFGAIGGGYMELARVMARDHAVDGTWATNPLSGMAGTLVSPSRGLLVFSPWVLVALVALPKTWPRLGRFPVLRAAVVALVPFLLLVSTTSTWWAGWVFGPRFWTDAMPVFGLLLGVALAWAREHSRPLVLAICAAGFVAVSVQALGAFAYPSSWNRMPTNVNFDTARLWDWRDSELTRARHEGPHPWSLSQVWRQLILRPTN